jgi:PAS domain S-box-containing protein
MPDILERVRVSSVLSTAMLPWHLARRMARAVSALMRRICHSDISEEPSQQQGDNLDAAHRAIARSEEHYRMVWNHSLHPGLLVDSNGIVRDLNRRGEIKFWRPAARLLGTPVCALFRSEDQPRLRELLAEVFATGKERSAGEWLVPAPTGDVFVMEVDLVPLEQNGRVGSVMIQLTDWTEKKQLQDQLLRSERLASLSQFASMFAHDIRNPLAGVKKTLELMGQRAELQTDPVRRWCEDLHFTIEQLQGMINDMLDVYQENYSGLPLITSSVCLNDLIYEVLHLFRLEAESCEITFKLQLPDDRLTLEADRRRLERVLSNLVHNALKFSPRRGLITVSARSESGGKPLRAAGDRAGAGSCLSISIEDEGPGIELDVLPHIFEMFFSHQGRQDWRSGRGLGLYFCRLVVEGHHGSIHAANRSTGGARFLVELPVGKESHVHHVAHC